MGRLDFIERKVLQMATGSSHPGYMQALWRPTRQDIDTVALSEKFAGDPETNGLNRRGWHNLGVVAVSGASLERLILRPNAVPAVAFAMGQRLVVGRLESDAAFGHVEDSGEYKRGHAMRIGPGDLQFTIGVIDEEGTFVGPPAEMLTSLGPIPDTLIGDQYGGFAQTSFS